MITPMRKNKTLKISPIKSPPESYTLISLMISPIKSKSQKLSTLKTNYLPFLSSIMSNTLKSISKHNLTKIITRNIIKIKILHYKKVKKLKLPLLSTSNKNL